MNLPPLVQTAVLHFGEMGSRWGFNRTVGQIYALLFLSSQPLNAETIASQLGFSRSNVSMGLKELQGWKLIHLKHLPGDRREYFTTPDDVWEILLTIVEERKKREIDPTLSMLRDALMQSPTTVEERDAQVKLSQMHELIELLAGWYGDVRELEPDRLLQLLALGSRVQKVLEIKDRLSPLSGRKSAPRPDLPLVSEPSLGSTDAAARS